MPRPRRRRRRRRPRRLPCSAWPSRARSGRTARPGRGRSSSPSMSAAAERRSRAAAATKTVSTNRMTARHRGILAEPPGGSRRAAVTARAGVPASGAGRPTVLGGRKGRRRQLPQRDEQGEREQQRAGHLAELLGHDGPGHRVVEHQVDSLGARPTRAAPAPRGDGERIRRASPSSPCTRRRRRPSPRGEERLAPDAGHVLDLLVERGHLVEPEVQEHEREREPPPPGSRVSERKRPLQTAISGRRPQQQAGEDARRSSAPCSRRTRACRRRCGYTSRPSRPAPPGRASAERELHRVEPAARAPRSRQVASPARAPGALRAGSACDMNHHRDEEQRRGDHLERLAERLGMAVPGARGVEEAGSEQGGDGDREDAPGAGRVDVTRHLEPRSRPDGEERQIARCSSSRPSPSTQVCTPRISSTPRTSERHAAGLEPEGVRGAGRPWRRPRRRARDADSSNSADRQRREADPVATSESLRSKKRSDRSPGGRRSPAPAKDAITAARTIKYMPGLKPASKLEGEVTHSVEPLL